MHAERHGLVEEQPLVRFHLWTDLEQLVVPDQLLRGDLEYLLSGDLDVLGVEPEDGVVGDFALVVKEPVVAVNASVDEVGEVLDIEGHLLSLFF